MIKNYLKIFFRNIVKHKIYSAINILGLAIGLACCLVISLFVYQELSYDRHYENSDRIFRIARVIGEGRNNSISTQYLLAPLLKQNFAEIEQVTRYEMFDAFLSGNGQEFLEQDIGFADNSFFEIFDFQWLAGDPGQAFVNPFSIVLTESLANKYFGSIDPLGKVLLLNGQHSLQVAGVIEDLPVNTHIKASAWGSMDLLEALYQREGMDINVWNFSSVFTYVMLDESADIKNLESQFSEFVNQQVPANMTQMVSMSATNISDIHMRNSARFAILSNPAKVTIFSAIAICILLIAVINFLNLSMARSLSRAQEVGVRKSVGANRRQLISQFLLESFVMTTVAMLIGVGLVEIFLPVINQIMGQELTLFYITEPLFFVSLIAFTLILSVVAGYYPAIHLSAHQLSSAIKGEHTHGRRGILLRNSLVVLQFTISITLIVSSIVVFQQMKLTRNMNLGFNEEQLVVFTLPLAEEMDINTAWGSFKNQLLSNPGIISATHSVYSPVQGGRMDIAFSNEDKSVKKAFPLFWIEPDFFETYQIDLLAGRYFSEDSVTDMSRYDPDNPGREQGSVILSEQAALDFGWTPHQAIGQIIVRGDEGWDIVIGVVANTVPSVKEGIASNIYIVPSEYNYSFMRGLVAVRLSGINLEQTLNHIDITWNAFVLDEPVNRMFLDDQVEALYQQEQMQMGMFSLSALLAVLIACFGLYGLAAFNTEHRTKEIGVRKVMGGSVWSIVLMLTNDFSILVLISNVIAWPVAYYVMNQWLANFAYRIDLTPIIFIGSGLIALCIAWVTVGGTAARAASQKPVLALRYE